MPDQETEILAKIRTEYDGAGAAKAREDLASTAQSAASLSHQNVSSPTASPTTPPRSKEIEQSELLTAAMKLEIKTRRELEQEILRLTAAIKTAASANDSNQYSRLKSQLEQAKQAMERLNTASGITRASVASQALAGMQFASQLGTLASEARNGQLNIASLSNAVLSFSMALKAGLGPIGWVMMGLQGIQMAASAIISHQEKMARAAAAAAAREEAARIDSWRRQMAAEAQLSETIISDYNAQAATAAAAAEKEYNARIRILQDEETNANAADERKRRLADAELTLTQAELKAKLDLGSITQESFDKQYAAAERNHTQILANIAAESAARRHEAADEALQEANLRSDTLKQQLEDFAADNRVFLEVEPPPPQKIKLLEDAINKHIPINDSIWNSFQSIRDNYDNLASALKSMGISLNEGGSNELENILLIAQEISARRTIYDKLNDQRQHASRAADEAFDAAERAAENNNLEQHLLQITKKTLSQQERSTNATAGKKDAEQRAAAAAADTQKQHAAELRHILDAYKTSRSYADQDTRTEEQKLQADKQNLTARLHALRQLQSTPGLDTQTQDNINAALRQTQSELRAYNQSIRQSQISAQRSLSNWKAPNLQATNKTLSGNLRNLEYGYANLARQAEAAARKGAGTQELDKYRTKMASLAYAIERLSGNTGKMASAHQKAMADLYKASQSSNGLSATQNQANAIARALGQSLPYHQRKANADKRSTKAAQDEARARERSARAAQQQQRRSTTNNKPTNNKSPKPTPSTPPTPSLNNRNNNNNTAALQATIRAQSAKISSITSAVASINSQLQAATQSLQQLATSIATLTSTTSQMAAAATQASSRAAQGISTLTSQLNNLRTQVNNMNRP